MSTTQPLGFWPAVGTTTRPKTNGSNRSRRTSTNVLRHLTKAAEKDAHFATLTAAIPVKEKVAEVVTL